MNGTMLLRGREVHYVVKSSARARRVSLRIRDSSGVEIVVPSRMRFPGAEPVLQRQASWIIRTLDRIARGGNDAALVSFEDGTRIPFLEQELTLRIVPATGRRARVVHADGELTVSLPPHRSGDVSPLLERWYFARAKEIIPRRVSELNRTCGFDYASVAVRNERTRWGSCSPRGTLNFNWRLLILPPFVADYLIFHELAHLKHLDHSDRFWRIVAGICPFYKDAERWLRRNGRSVLM